MSLLLAFAGALQDLPPHLVLPQITDPSKWGRNKLFCTSDKQQAIVVHTFVALAGPNVNRDVPPKDLFPSGQPLNPDSLLDPGWRARASRERRARPKTAARTSKRPLNACTRLPPV